MKKNTIQADVLEYLESGHSIDAPKATAMFGYIQLPVAIHHLRNKGHDIRTTMVTSKDGNKFAVYRFVAPFKLGERVRLPSGLIGSVVKAAPEGENYVSVKVKHDARLHVHHKRNLEHVNG